MWLYKGKEFTSEMIDENYAFVYELTNKVNGKKYIGKKVFWSVRTLPPLAGKKRKRKVKKESDWFKYYGSSKYVQKDIDAHGLENFTREIITLCPNKTEANYLELVLQVKLNVLDAVNESGERIYYNENINRVWYPSKDKVDFRMGEIDLYESLAKERE